MAKRKVLEKKEKTKQEGMTENFGKERKYQFQQFFSLLLSLFKNLSVTIIHNIGNSKISEINKRQVNFVNTSNTIWQSDYWKQKFNIGQRLFIFWLQVFYGLPLKGTWINEFITNWKVIDGLVEHYKTLFLAEESRL